MTSSGREALQQNAEVADATPAPPRKRVQVRKDKTNPRRFAYLILLLFAIPPGWPLFLVGSLLVIAAVALHGWAAGYLARAGYPEREKILTVRGPYRFNRNPYYLAHLTMDFGFFCMAGLPLLYLIYFPVIYAVYRHWVINEEPFLEAEFGDDYRAWKRDVPRWGMRLTPAAARGHEQVFSWAMFRLNNELPRAASHVLLLSIFTLYFIFGNPWANVDPLARATLAGAIMAWFLLRDITPLDVSDKHGGWLGLAAVIATGGAAFVTVAPVWARWSDASSWIAIIAAALLGVTAVLLTLPAVTRATAKNFNDVLRQPMGQWYAVGLGLGLLTLTYAGVWLSIIVSLTAWALSLAGVMPVRSVPQSASAAFALFVGFSLFTGYAIARLVA